MTASTVSRLASLACLMLAIPALADDAGRLIAVQGSATIQAAPDRATLNMGVQARHRELSTARREVAETVERFLEFAEDQGIERSAVRTSNLNIRPEYRWDKDSQQQMLLGYFVQRDIAVELADMDQLGVILEGTIDAGINQVQPPVLSHSNEKELTRQALAAATEDARQNAQRIAESLGAQLGPVRSVSVMGGASPPMPQMRAMAMSDQMESAAETYTAGQISIAARVSAEFDVLVDE